MAGPPSFPAWNPTPSPHPPRVPSPLPSGASVHLRGVGPSPRDIATFARVQHDLAPRDDVAVLPLLAEVEKVLSEANPFWRRASRQLWTAEHDGRAIGRIAAILDPEHERQHGERCAYFGFFECVDDEPVARRLLDAASAWARDRGAVRMRGPLNPNINEECGVLVDGFHLPNAVMMPHNPPWYPRLIESAGFAKAKDLVGFDIQVADGPADRLSRIRDVVRRRFPGLLLKPVTRRNLRPLLPALTHVYNASWERNWSAVPMSPEEITFLAERLEPLLVDGLVWIAEANGEPAGLLLMVPDINPALRPLRGRLASPAILRALPTLLGWRRPERFRLIALGVTPPHRRRGLEGWMFAEGLAAAQRHGFVECEASWVLEDNLPVQQLAAQFRGRITRRYRLYDRVL